MSTKYQEYETTQVRLSDVLATLDEKIETMTSGLIGGVVADEESLRQALGRIQGWKSALAHVRYAFGAHDDSAPY